MKHGFIWFLFFEIVFFSQKQRKQEENVWFRILFCFGKLIEHIKH